MFLGERRTRIPVRTSRDVFDPRSLKLAQSMLQTGTTADAMRASLSVQLTADSAVSLYLLRRNIDQLYVTHDLQPADSWSKD